MRILKTYSYCLRNLAMATLCFLTSTASAQFQTGIIVDQSRQRSFTLFSNFFIQEINNPSNAFFATPDPSGRTFIMMSSSTPNLNAFFVDWNRNLVEINHLGGARIVGFCNCALPANPFIVNFQPPIFNPNIGVHFDNQIQPVPTQFFNPAAPFGKILITDEAHANDCFNNSKRSDGTLDEQKFGECMIQAMTTEKDQEIIQCVKNSKNSEELALCLIGKLGGQREREVTAQVQQCYSQYGTDFSRYPLCLAGTVVQDDKLQRLLACMEDQARNNGKITFAGTAICYGAQSFNLNAETQIILECAVATGGEPYAFASCAGGQLLARELTKCLNDGVGGAHGCFGQNNDIIKALNRTTDLIKMQFGVGSPQLQMWETALNDLTKGPGPNNTAVKAITDASNTLGKGVDNVGKEISRTIKKIF